MNRMIAWFATNHVAANLLMGIAVIAGLAALTVIPVKMIPDIDSPAITITVPYLGAAPEEVEVGVCTRIEERVNGITGVQEVSSIAREGSCATTVTLFFDADRARVLDEVQNQIDSIETFPVETEEPIIKFLQFTSVVVEIAVTGPTDERLLKELGLRVRDDLLALPEITSVVLANVRPYEISVEVSKQSLLRNGLTFDHVAEALRKRSLDLPGGSIKTNTNEILLRSSGQAYWGEDFKKLEITTRADGTRVLLEDIADVVDGFEDTSQSLTFDGKPAALIKVGRVGDQDLRLISEVANAFVESAGSRYPEGVRLTLWNDESELVTDRLQTLIDSGLQGLLLVLILLALFLRPRLAIWVTAGIPIAFLGAIFLIYWTGYSIDSISVIGFILALGMLVDDAVVVGESAYVAQRSGAGQLAGAIAGAQQVLVPVTFGVLTTIVAFTPLLFSAGSVGELMSVIAATVIFCLFFSLVECQMILPAHLGHSGRRMPFGDFGMVLTITLVLGAFALAPSQRTAFAFAIAFISIIYASHLLGLLSKLSTQFTRLQLKLENGLQSLIDNQFRNLARRAVSARRMTLAIALAISAASIGIVVGGHLPFSFLLSTPGDSVTAQLTMQTGVAPRLTDAVISDLIDSANVVKEQLTDENGVSSVVHVMVARGGHPSKVSFAAGVSSASGSHLGEVVMQLTPSESRDLSTEQIADLWREVHGLIGDGQELLFNTDRIGGAADIEIDLLSDNLDDLRAAATTLRTALTEYPGVYEVRDSLRRGKEELQLSVSPAGEALGVTLADLGRQVRQAFYGEEVQRVQRGDEDVRIMVRFTADERQSLDTLYALRIRTPSGAAVPFRTAAEVLPGRGLASIERSNGQRSITVTANVDPTVNSAELVLAGLSAGVLPNLVATHSGMSYSSASDELQREVMQRLIPMFLLAMFVIFALLALPLRSYIQPLIIMTTVPFAFVGMIWGHVLMDLLGLVDGLSMPSMFGAVAATGVVINATLVLLHEFNHRLEAGDTHYDALVNAATTRSRPILLTTITTFAGLLPLMLSKSVQAQPLIPMATALAFGVLIAAFASLLVTPALVHVLHDITGGAKRLGQLLGNVAGAAPRLQKWVDQFPYVQESVRSQEFADLEIPIDSGLDEETAQIAREGLVRLYYEREFNRDEMRTQLSAIAAKAPTTDELVSEVRVWAEQRAFQIGVHLLRGVVNPSEAAGPLSNILDSCLTELQEATKRDLEYELEQTLPGAVCVVALGSLGRQEFTIGDPLSLMIVYEAPDSGSIDPADTYTQFAQRFQRLVRNLSPAGMLFESSSLYSLTTEAGEDIALSLTQLRDYFEEPAAKIAELRAQTQARVIDTSEEIGDRFTSLRIAAIARAPIRDAVLDDIRAARQQIVSKRRANDIWDIRHAAGGLADLELFVELLQLTSPADSPTMRANGSHAVFDAAVADELLTSDEGERLNVALRLWQCLDGYFSMTTTGRFRPKAANDEQRKIIARIAGAEEFDELPTLISDTAAQVSEILDSVLEARAELRA